MTYWDNQTIDKIRRGYYSAVYFNRTQQILLKEKNVKSVTMQVFQKQDAVLCGVNQVIELFRIAAGYFDNGQWIGKQDELKIETLNDGDATKPWETLMHITGPYAYFAHLESLYLGILARATKIATNTKNVVKAANGKQVIFFADRFDYFLNQELDGYAAHIGGINGICTEAHGLLWSERPVGTLPHALIAINNGNTVKAAEEFSKYYPDAPLIVLVDFDNDCVKTSLEVAKAFGKKLWGVRLDTSEMNIDKSLLPGERGKRQGESSLSFHPSPLNKGVTPHLVQNVRIALDQNGFSHVKIVVSGGFDEQKINMFEKEKVPVDVYGVGSSLMKGNIDFTADIVKVEEKEIAKEGRKYIPNNLLKLIT